MNVEYTQLACPASVPSFNSVSLALVRKSATERGRSEAARLQAVTPASTSEMDTRRTRARGLFTITTNLRWKLWQRQRGLGRAAPVPHQQQHAAGHDEPRGK